MDKALVLNKIIEYKMFKSDAEFARFLDITPQNLSKWKQRNTYDTELIYTKCPELNPEWLLTGQGSMLKVDAKTNISQTITGDSNIQSGNNTSITGDCKGKIEELQKQLEEYKKQLREKENQVSQLINTVTALSQSKTTK